MLRAASRRERLAAVGAWTLAGFGISFGLTFFAVSRTYPAAAGAIALWLVVTAVVGALVAARRPHHPCGWLLSAMALAVAIGVVCQAIAQTAVEAGHTGWWVQAAAWLESWIRVPGFALLAFLLLTFPTGSLPSSRWRWVLWAGVVGVVSHSIGAALAPGPLEAVPGLRNPLGIEGASSVLETVETLGTALLLATGLATLFSLFLRFRRAHGIEREQMKWIAFSGALLPATALVAMLASGPVNELSFFLGIAGLLSLPLAIGAAVLRYHLFDIDVIINRTVVYALLTGTLGLAYVAMVVLLQQLFNPLTQESDLAIAGSTLAVAGLFRPARARIQGLIDRRFFRRKYDAARTLEAFAARLRDELDLQMLTEEMLAVVNRTMQPTHLSAWLRASNRG